MRSTSIYVCEKSVSSAAVTKPCAALGMLGYGLKYGTAFGDTHLGRVGWQGAKGGRRAKDAQR